MKKEEMQSYQEHRVKAIIGAKLIHKTTNYVYAMRSLEECGTLYDYLANIKTNKIVNYSINPIDKPIDDRKFILDITIKHQFNN